MSEPDSGLHEHLVDTPIGPMLLVGDGEGLREARFLHPDEVPVSCGRGSATAVRRVARAARELEEYFKGHRRVFEVPLLPRGTEFQESVWKTLADIPHGDTWSYGQLAARVGRPNAARAVGAANGQNPLPVFLPCHRVIGADGSLTGYGGGLERKRWLLDLEQDGSRTANSSLFHQAAR